MVYGATGYTGRMAAEHAASAGLNPILAGRDTAALAALGLNLGSQHRSFTLDDDAMIDEALHDVTVLLNCAGPYHRTAGPLIRAAIRTGTHYLDVAAELDSYRLAETFDLEAQTAGVMLLPGSGGSVAMLGSLAGRAAETIGQPRSVAIALHVSGSMSRGSALSAQENLTTECLARIDGALVDCPPDGLRHFDFGKGPVACVPVTLPDLLTIWKALEVPNIATYVHVSGDAFPSDELAELPDGPTRAQRDANRYQATVEVTDSEGRISRAVLDTLNGYDFTPIAAVEAARRALAGEVAAGFQTPAALFGNGFAETIAGTTITFSRGTPDAR